MKDLYQILQVDRAAHPEVIRAAYRTLLRSLKKHPDLGGRASEARPIIEAYRTLGDADRRRAYDLWLATTAAPDPGLERPLPALMPSGAATWIRAALPGYGDAPAAPFAAHFALVLKPPRALASLVYVKPFAPATSAGWRGIFTVWRAVRLARSGFWPYADLIVLVTDTTEGVDRFLTEAARPRTRSSINRCALAVLSFAPPRMHLVKGTVAPAPLHDLIAAAARPGRRQTVPSV